MPTPHATGPLEVDLRLPVDTTPEQRKAAARTVVEHIHDDTDRRLVLTRLGLIDAPRKAWRRK